VSRIPDEVGPVKRFCQVSLTNKLGVLRSVPGWDDVALSVKTVATYRYSPGGGMELGAAEPSPLVQAVLGMTEDPGEGFECCSIRRVYPWGTDRHAIFR
jgi:hypothetical protein